MSSPSAPRARGVPVLYYITPQVWAWGAGRLEKLAQLITQGGGHPAVRGAAASRPRHRRDVRRPSAARPRGGNARPRARRARALGLPDETPVLALFPGSRAQEIAAPPRRLRRDGARAAAPRAGAARHRERRARHRRSIRGAVRFPLVHSVVVHVLRAADAALCKSGTTTLEAAVAGCPLVVGVSHEPSDVRHRRRVVTIPHIGLVNVVAGREVARRVRAGRS